jgi:sugar phosphate isomerase/epimerase
MDRILITTNCIDLSDYRDLAEASGAGLELQAFAEPAALNGGWREILANHKRQLKNFNGDLGVHGAFYDMSSASRDPEVVALTRKRYRQNLVAAAELGAHYVVLHLNYLGPMNLLGYHPDWHRRQVEFWSEFIDEVVEVGIPVLLENSWENSPEIILDVIREVNNPYLRTCLDVAHATLYSKLPFREWLDAFEPYLECCHLNDHDGEHDLHLPLGQGVVDYNDVMDSLNELERKPYFCLELTSLTSIDTSLEFLRSKEIPA